MCVCAFAGVVYQYAPVSAHHADQYTCVCNHRRAMSVCSPQTMPLSTPASLAPSHRPTAHLEAADRAEAVGVALVGAVPHVCGVQQGRHQAPVNDRAPAFKLVAQPRLAVPPRERLRADEFAMQQPAGWWARAVSRGAACVVGCCVHAAAVAKVLALGMWSSG